MEFLVKKNRVFVLVCCLVALCCQGMQKSAEAALWENIRKATKAISDSEKLSTVCTVLKKVLLLQEQEVSMILTDPEELLKSLWLTKRISKQDEAGKFEQFLMSAHHIKGESRKMVWLAMLVKCASDILAQLLAQTDSDRPTRIADKKTLGSLDGIIGIMQNVLLCIKEESGFAIIAELAAQVKAEAQSRVPDSDAIVQSFMQKKIELDPRVGDDNCQCHALLLALLQQKCCLEQLAGNSKLFKALLENAKTIIVAAHSVVIASGDGSMCKLVSLSKKLLNMCAIKMLQELAKITGDFELILLSQCVCMTTQNLLTMPFLLQGKILMKSLVLLGLPIRIRIFVERSSEAGVNIEQHTIIRNSSSLPTSVESMLTIECGRFVQASPKSPEDLIQLKEAHKQQEVGGTLSDFQSLGIDPAKIIDLILLNFAQHGQLDKVETKGKGLDILLAPIVGDALACKHVAEQVALKEAARMRGCSLENPTNLVVFHFCLSH